MMSLRRMSSLCALAVTLACSALSWGQELSVTADHANGVYAVGETVRWTITTKAAAAKPTTAPAATAAATAPAKPFTEARYVIKKGGMTELRKGSVTFTDGSATVEAPFDAPGTLLLEVTAGAGDKPTKANGGAIADVEKIQPSAPRPDDFDAFWKSQIDELAKITPNPKLEPGESGKADLDYWKVQLDNIRGTHIQGQIARPKKGEKFPAMLVVQWAGVYPLKKEWVTNHAANGWLVLNILAHDLPIDQPEQFYKDQAAGPLKDYTAIGNDDRNTSYFLRMYLSCYRAADYLASRDDWDGKTLVVTGGSQGGLQSIMIAGLHPKITALLANVPAGCDMTGPLVGRSPGWPNWYWKVKDGNDAKVREASKYYDVVNFASRVKCPALVGVGLVDTTCPPAGVAAAFNQMQGPKELVIMPKGDHGGTGGTHANYYSRFGAWQAALVKGQPAPVAAAK